MGHSRQIIQQQCEFDMAWYSNYDHIYDNRQKWQQQLVWLFSCGFIFSLLKRHKKCPPPPIWDWNQRSFFICIRRYHSLGPHPLKGKYILIASPRGRGIWKILKRGWKYGAVAGLPKRGYWHFFFLIFSGFIIFTFTNYFTPCKIVLCIWRKKIFFLPP